MCQTRDAEAGRHFSDSRPIPSDSGMISGLSDERHSRWAWGDGQGQPCRVQGETLFPLGVDCGRLWKSPNVPAKQPFHGDPGSLLGAARVHGPGKTSTRREKMGCTRTLAPSPKEHSTLKPYLAKEQSRPPGLLVSCWCLDNTCPQRWSLLSILSGATLLPLDPEPKITRAWGQRNPENGDP